MNWSNIAYLIGAMDEIFETALVQLPNGELVPIGSLEKIDGKWILKLEDKAPAKRSAFADIDLVAEIDAYSIAGVFNQ